MEQHKEDPIELREPAAGNTSGYYESSPHTTAYTKLFANRSRSFVRSTKSLKAESRAAVLAAFLEHKEKRMAVKRREEGEKRRIMNVWKQEERLAREKQLQELFSRLSKRKEVIDESKARRHSEMIQEKIQRSREKAKHFRESLGFKNSSMSHKERLETCYKKKDDILAEKIQKKIQESEEKFAKADLVLLRLKEYRGQTAQLNKERREKKILRSKVQSILSKETGGKCERHGKNEVRFLTALQKDELKAREAKKQLLPEVKSQPNLGKLLPDEVLLNYFNVEELRYIRDDLNYFITNKQDREKVTLFNLPLGQTTKSSNTKLRTLSAQGEFNLSTVESLLKKREFHPYVPTRQDWYKSWLRNLSTDNVLPANYGFRSARAVSERSRQRQQYNYQSVREFEESNKHSLYKKIMERQQKADLRSTTKVKEKKDQAAVRNRKRSDFILELQRKKAEEKAANDILQTYLIEVQQAYIQRQVEEKVNQTNESKVLQARKELSKWKERCEWITDTVRKKDPQTVLMQNGRKTRTNNMSLPKLPLSLTSVHNDLL